MSILFKNSEVSFIIPNSSDVAKLAEHFESFADVSYDDWDFLSTFELFDHPVWWVEPGLCQSTAFEDCFCGKIDFLSVIYEIPDLETKKYAFTTHAKAMTEAFQHYWSGDGLLSGKVFDVCTSCIALGEDHVALVGYQAEQLALEYGAALAACANDLGHGVIFN